MNKWIAKLKSLFVREKIVYVEHYDPTHIVVTPSIERHEDFCTKDMTFDFNLLVEHDGNSFTITRSAAISRRALAQAKFDGNISMSMLFNRCSKDVGEMFAERMFGEIWRKML